MKSWRGNERQDDWGKEEMGEKESILIVDDDTSTSRTLSLIFGENGYETEVAGTGREAIEKVQGRFFNLALLDIRLPDMEGVELLTPLKEIYPDMAVIMTIAYASLDTAVRALNEGASAYITKPLNMEQVLATVKEALEKQHLVMENRRLYEEAQRELAERKRAEEVLRESEERYRTLFESTAEGILITDCEIRKFKYANPAISRMLGYSVKELKKMSISGIHPKDSLEYVVSEIEAQARIEKTLSRNIPCLRKDGMIIYADIKTVKTNMDGRECIIDFFSDVTERTLAEQQRELTTKKLQQLLEDITQTISLTTELRDPHTFGHQQRTTQLACSIAKEMGLSDDQLECLRVVSLLHDIGKITVPAEILSKPRQLTQTEFNLIKVHPRVGHTILKRISFPWPVAQIVLQHHERMDGSGYPQGLSDGEIFLEARILAVADVVEAMSSHRPYRPALGLGMALDEISKNKGILYAPEVVDACLKVFTEQRFEFE